jgi:hypothetical protein
MFVPTHRAIWFISFLILLVGMVLEYHFAGDALARSGAAIAAFGLVGHGYILKRNSFVSANAGRKMANQPVVKVIGTGLRAQQEIETAPIRSLYVAAFGTIVWGFGDFIPNLLRCGTLSC